jgi:HlyD family secretion protein
MSSKIVRQCRLPAGRTVLALVVLLVVLGGSAWAWQAFFAGKESGSLAEEPVTVVAERGAFDHVVLEQGELESSSNIDVVNEVKARGSTGMTILWVVPEGTYVKKGDKLVELDSSALEDELSAQRIKVLSAEALVISSEATVSTNEIALEEYLKGTYQSERKAILSEIDLAEQQLRKSELNLDSARRLAAKGLLKGLQIEAEEFAVSNAQNVLESAQARLKVLDELTKEKNRVQLASNIDASKAKLSSDRNVLVEEQAKQLEIEELIRKCIINSPADGIVVYNNERGRGGSNDFTVKEGAIVRERQTIIKLPDPTKMHVKALVNESRIVRIKPGMVAKVRVSAYPDEMLARVKRVNKYSEPGSWFSSSVKEYAAYLEIVDPPEAIRTGMSAEVRIFVEKLDDALQIPVHGIYEYQEHLFCLVKDGSKYRTKEVKIGASNDKHVTIAEGLAEGDQVVLNPRGFLSLMEFPDMEDPSQNEALEKLASQEMKPEDLPVGRGEWPGAAKGGRPTGAGTGMPAGSKPGAAGGGNTNRGAPGAGAPNGQGRPGGPPPGVPGGPAVSVNSERGQRGGPRVDPVDAATASTPTAVVATTEIAAPSASTTDQSAVQPAGSPAKAP